MTTKFDVKDLGPKNKYFRDAN